MFAKLDNLDVDIPINSNDKIAFIHLDYNGSHALISSANGDNFYLNLKSSVAKPLKRLKVYNLFCY